MNTLKSTAKTALAAVVGFALGATLWQPVTAKAAGRSGIIYVREVTPGATTPDPRIAAIDVVGFSYSVGA